MTENRQIHLSTVKTMLTRFADSRAGLPREQVEREFGELLLYLIRLAEKNGVDLIAASEQQIASRGKIDMRIARKSQP
jgi:NTP pyrophosphatase (non-canonical NTP hydrolase)